MRPIPAPEYDVSEDGHPCEAALEFRRAAIRWGVAEEVPADALDLAVAFAWVGKAVSRTRQGGRWLAVGTDPNTWQMVRAMAADDGARDAALEAARNEAPAAGMDTALRRLRASQGFAAACAAVSAEGGLARPGSGRAQWLRRAALRLPGGRVALPASEGGELVSLERFRRMKELAS